MPLVFLETFHTSFKTFVFWFSVLSDSPKTSDLKVDRVVFCGGFFMLLTVILLDSGL